MLKMTEAQLDRAINALGHHGHGSFFPNPPEYAVIQANWNQVRAELAEIDLDTYSGYEACEMFAPKSRLNIRRVAQLHPYDLILYTALVMELRDSVTYSRLPPDQNRVFSHRADGVVEDVLYTKTPGYPEFKNRLRELGLVGTSLLGLTDIADFYPRVYQHRLVNALLSASKNAKADEIRCLEKMLYRFANGASYGIPIGPLASRVLAEALLVDVDSTLIMLGIDFVRFVDDYVIIGNRIEDVEFGIRALAEILFLNHGLTLQTAKTKVVKSADYLVALMDFEEKESAHRELIDITGGYEDDADSYEDLSEDAKSRIDALNLSEMLEEALGGENQIDYREISFILSRLSSLREPDLIPIVLDNLEKLFPVAHAIARFFSAFDKLEDGTIRDVTNRLLLPIETSQHVSEYYAVWILNLFYEKKGWNHAPRLARIYAETQSDAVKRYAALALSTSGTRAEALTVMRTFRSSAPLVRSALLLASSNLGRDERKFAIKSLQLRNLLERLLGGQ
jgi:hypothetical protein